MSVIRCITTTRNIDYYIHLAPFQFSRSRTPFGEVPISCVYGFDYPLANAANSLLQDEDMERRLRNHE